MKQASLILSGALFLVSAADCAAIGPGENAPEEDTVWQGDGFYDGRGPGAGAGGYGRFAEGKRGYRGHDGSGSRGGRKMLSGRAMRSEQEALDIIKKHGP